MPATLVFYESPHRLAASLGDMAAVLGAREAAVARELTKRFEELRRGALDGLARECADNPPRGEIVVLVAAAGEVEQPSEAAVAERLRGAMQSGSLSEAVNRLKQETGLSRSALYRRALALQAAERDAGP